MPTVAREVYDVVGAGDTVTAYLAAMLAAGGTPREAAVVANIAAGIEVGKLGAPTVGADGGAGGVRRIHSAAIADIGAHGRSFPLFHLWVIMFFRYNTLIHCPTALAAA